MGPIRIWNPEFWLKLQIRDSVDSCRISKFDFEFNQIYGTQLYTGLHMRIFYIH